MVEAAVKPQTGAEEVRWDLSVFYSRPDDPAIEADMADIDRQIEAFVSRYRGKVAALDAEGMMDAMQETEALMDSIEKMQYYAHLLYSTDTNNPTYGALVQKMTEYGATIQQRLIFFELEWAALDDEAADRDP